MRRRSRRFLGVRAFDDYPLRELVPYIDWMPFFNAWEFAGKFPDILHDPVVGEAASSLYADAHAHAEAIDRRRNGCRARAVVGFFPRQQRGRRRYQCVCRRQRGKRSSCGCIICASRNPSRRIRRSLAWRISSRRRNSGRADYLGAFAVTAGIGIDEHVARFEAAAR